MAFGKQPAGKGTYDTATQSFRKPSKSAPHAGAKSGFKGASSTTRPLSNEEHQAAAQALSNAGLHRAASHHRNAADQMKHESTTSGQGDADQQQGMFGNNVPGTAAGVPGAATIPAPSVPGVGQAQPGIRIPGGFAASLAKKKGKPNGATGGAKPSFGK